MLSTTSEPTSEPTSEQYVEPLNQSSPQAVRSTVQALRKTVASTGQISIGYQRLAEIQEEILWLCEAAHIPVIWATQVLENLVKKGIPSRAEMTDAAMADRAECIMLNKGHLLLRR